MLENQADKEQNEIITDDESNVDESEKNVTEQLSGDEGDDESLNDNHQDEIVVSIGDELPPVEDEKPAPKWVKELRKTNRELQRKNRELESRLTANNVETKPTKLEPKPTLDGCDYDSEKYEAELETWYEKKKQIDLEIAKAKEAEEAHNRQFQQKLEGYAKARAQLKVRDYDEAEEVVLNYLDVNQQGVIVHGADNSALVVYALGKNPKKAKELAAIKDPIQFAFAVAKLEKDLKVGNRTKQAPPPEKVVSGNGRISGSVDSELERLREQAAKTGDISAVLRYKRQRKKTG